MKERIIIGVLLFIGFAAVAYFDIFWLNVAIFNVILILAFIESSKLYKISFNLNMLVAVAFFWLLVFMSDFNSIFKISMLMLIVIASILAFMKHEELKIILPFIYPTIPIFFLFGLYANYGMIYLFWLIFINVACDTFGYFAGKFFGKHKFCLSSPNKTLEGIIAGFLAGIVFGCIYGLIFTNIVFEIVLSASILVSLFGIFGDLFESYLKRLCDIKDTGKLLGEQGGILDRIDAYLFGVIAMILVIA